LQGAEKNTRAQGRVRGIYCQ